MFIILFDLPKTVLLYNIYIYIYVVVVSKTVGIAHLPFGNLTMQWCRHTCPRWICPLRWRLPAYICWWRSHLSTSLKDMQLFLSCSFNVYFRAMYDSVNTDFCGNSFVCPGVSFRISGHRDIQWIDRGILLKWPDKQYKICWVWVVVFSKSPAIVIDI